MQLVLVSDHIAPGLCPAVAAAFRLNWTVHVIGFRGAKASALADGKKGRNGKPELIGAALDAPAFAAAIGDDAILLLDAYDAYVQLGPARALAAYCALQRDAQVEVGARARGRASRRVGRGDALPVQAQRDGHPPALARAVPARARRDLLGGQHRRARGRRGRLPLWRDAHAALRGGSGSRERPQNRADRGRRARVRARRTTRARSSCSRSRATSSARLARDTARALPRCPEPAPPPRTRAARRAFWTGPSCRQAGARARADRVAGRPEGPGDRAQSTDYAGALACGPVGRVRGAAQGGLNVTAAALGARVTACAPTGRASAT